MKKVECFATYRKTETGFHLVTLTVKTRENAIVSLPVDEKAFPFFHNMYESVMKTLTQNHYCVNSWSEFGAMWYNVM